MQMNHWYIHTKTRFIPGQEGVHVKGDIELETADFIIVRYLGVSEPCSTA